MTDREREGLEREARMLECRLAPQRSSYDGCRYIVDRPELRMRLDGLRARLASSQRCPYRADLCDCDDHVRPGDLRNYGARGLSR